MITEEEVRAELRKVLKELKKFDKKKEADQMSSEDWEAHDIVVGWRDALQFVLGDSK